MGENRYYCPYCKEDITEMSVKDSIGHLITQDEIGTVYFYRCPICKRKRLIIPAADWAGYGD